MKRISKTAFLAIGLFVDWKIDKRTKGAKLSTGQVFRLETNAMDMRAAFHGFPRFVSVGLLNTLIHWSTFFVLHTVMGFRQAPSNFVSFCLAVSFSFYANARYTFKQRTSVLRYVLFVGFMGVLSYGVGYGADQLLLPGLVTLVVFSGISLVCGFFYSKYFIFRGREQ
ncbi:MULTISPECIES: GtrA family protein [unclassified Pseudomonas]|uniref:GtrA family protein n=1 Tax=Pseudomonas TaxID=286 RepID=UPI0035323515